MKITEPYQKIQIFEDKGEMHIAFGGMWNPEITREKMQEMSLAAIPLIKDGKPLYALTDFTDALPQDQESASIIAQQMQNAKHFNLKRVAVLNASALMKLQYQRVTKDIDVQYFTSKSEALHWLRAGR